MTGFPLTPTQAVAGQRAYARQSDLPITRTLDLCGVPLTVVLIPPGRFAMGEASAQPHEPPRHWVEFAQPFYLSQTPVTQAQWQAVMGSNPARFQGETLPIETVSWHDCMAFCAQAAVCSRYSLRLPSEAEWEYACRAGSATAYSFGDGENDLAAHGWYRGNAEHCSHPVATRKPNAWGLYDMHGGIDEFCLDVWHEDANGDYAGAPTDGSVWDEGGDVRYRVLRGGSWYDQGVHCRSPHRNYYAADVPTEDHGFRLVWIHDDR